MGDSYGKTNLVNTTSQDEGSNNKDLEHLIMKKQKNAQDFQLYRKLKKLDIGTNDIKQMSANLVISRLCKEGIEENECGLDDV